MSVRQGRRGTTLSTGQPKQLVYNHSYPIGHPSSTTGPSESFYSFQVCSQSDSKVQRGHEWQLVMPFQSPCHSKALDPFQHLGLALSSSRIQGPFCLAAYTPKDDSVNGSRANDIDCSYRYSLFICSGNHCSFCCQSLVQLGLGSSPGNRVRSSGSKHILPFRLALLCVLDWRTVMSWGLNVSYYSYLPFNLLDEGCCKKSLDTLTQAL